MTKLQALLGRFTYETLLVTAAMVVGNALGYAYQVIVARVLDVRVFGAFGALAGLFYIFALGASAYRVEIAAVVARTTAEFGEKRGLKLFLKTEWRLALVFLPVPIILALVSGPVSEAVHADSQAAVVVLGFAIFATLLTSTALGLLQGLQRFRRLALVGYFLPPTLKLVAGLAFLAAGFGLTGALAAMLVADLIAFAVALVPWRRRFQEAARQEPEVPAPAFRILFAGLPLAFFIAFPTNIDVLLVTQYFQPDEAGLYAALATFGKVIYFLPLAVSLVMVPKVVEKHALNSGSRRPGLQGLFLSLALAIPPLIVIWLFPGPIIQLLFGVSYSGASPLLGLYCLTMLIFAINLLLVQYALATERRRYVLMADALTLLIIPAVVIWHASLQQVILIMLVDNVSLLLLCLPALIRRDRQPVPQAEIHRE